MKKGFKTSGISQVWLSAWLKQGQWARTLVLQNQHRNWPAKVPDLCSHPYYNNEKANEILIAYQNKLFPSRLSIIFRVDTWLYQKLILTTEYRNVTSAWAILESHDSLTFVLPNLCTPANCSLFSTPNKFIATCIWVFWQSRFADCNQTILLIKKPKKQIFLYVHAYNIHHIWF